MNPFARIDRLGDRIERHLPWFLQWYYVGDPASWLQHALIAALVTFGGALFLALFGKAMLGAQCGAEAAVLFYGLREGYQASGHIRRREWSKAFRWKRHGRGVIVGWGADCPLDFIFPVLSSWAAFAACNVWVT